MISSKHLLLPAVLILSGAALAAEPQSTQDKDALIRNALSAAPPDIAKDATVMDWKNNTLQKGSNGYTCFPDAPHTPGDDPMCLDATWSKWADAWANKRQQPPPAKQLGIAYMLQGSSDASNTDPFATKPAPGEQRLDVGPHVMLLVPDKKMLDGLPTDPKNGGPWVMWKGTPYAHVMVPVAQR